MPRKPAVDKKVKRAVERSAERALMEERTAIAAITKVMLLEVPEPTRVLARIDAMVRAAEDNPKTPATMRRTLLDAARFVRTAIERETGRPQSLFDPALEHVKAKDVDKLVNPTEGALQLGLVNTGSVLGDVEAAHDERVQTIAVVHEALVELIRGPGAATDTELHGRYLRARMTEDLPPQSGKAIADRRRELVQAGRLVPAGKRDGVPAWDLVEREMLTTQRKGA